MLASMLASMHALVWTVPLKYMGSFLFAGAREHAREHAHEHARVQKKLASMLASFFKRMNMFILFKMLASMLASIFIFSIASANHNSLY